MSAIMTFQGIDIPHVSEVKERREMAADRRRTASNKRVQTIVGVKKIWDVTTTPLHPNEANALMELLDVIGFGEGLFWFEGAGLAVWATINPDILQEYVGFGDRKTGEWIPFGRILSFVVEES